jgi:hypothetical protein
VCACVRVCVCVHVQSSRLLWGQENVDIGELKAGDVVLRPIRRCWQWIPMPYMHYAVSTGDDGIVEVKRQRIHHAVVKESKLDERWKTADGKIRVHREMPERNMREGEVCAQHFFAVCFCDFCAVCMLFCVVCAEKALNRKSPEKQ